MSKPIVVGFDPLRADRAPLYLAAGLARATGAVIAVACYLHDPITNAVSRGEIERDLRQQALEVLTEAADETGELVAIGGPSPARAQSPPMIVPRGAGSALEQPPAGSQAAAP